MSPPGSPRPAVLVAHGILATGRAWRSFARRLGDARPDLEVHTLDLRGHGDGRGRPGPHTLGRAAADVVEAWAGHPVAALVGHSFGGKVMLSCAHAGLVVPQIWCLDSDPTASPNAPPSDVDRSLAVIAALGHKPQRAAVEAAFAAAGFAPGFIAWMTTNLERSPEGATQWRFDLPVVEELLASYRASDLSPVVRGAGPPEVHLVRGGRSSHWSAAGLTLFQSLPAARAHLLPEASHWLHVDAADELLRLLSQHLPRGPA